MNILFFTTISPFPQNGGEKIRSCYLLKALASLGHSVHAIIGNKEQVDLDEHAIPGVTFYTCTPPALTLADRLTGKFYFRQDPAVLKLFASICSITNIEVAVLDYGFVGQYIPWFNASRIPVILGTPQRAGRAYAAEARPGPRAEAAPQPAGEPGKNTRTTLLLAGRGGDDRQRARQAISRRFY